MGGLEHRQGLRISLRRWGPTVVLGLAGRLIIEAHVQWLADLTELMTCGGRSLLVLDLSGVSQIDCSGIGQLVGLYVRVQRVGGRFAVVNMESRQRHLLDISGLLALFPAFERPRTASSGRFTYDVA